MYIETHTYTTSARNYTANVSRCGSLIVLRNRSACSSGASDGRTARPEVRNVHVSPVFYVMKRVPRGDRHYHRDHRRRACEGDRNVSTATGY